MLSALFAACALVAPPFETEPREVVGWNVQVSKALLRDEPEATEKALSLLEAQLKEVVRVVPAPAVAKLRKVTLWMSPTYPGEIPKAAYHPSEGWLIQNKRNPAMAQSVEFTNIPIFEREMKRMPNFALHELAHAYHHRFLADGFQNKEILAAFRRASESGSYDQVERRNWDGQTAIEKAYAMTNPQEYFAETTEAFFSRNDFFPYTRAELKEHDPEMFELLETLWHLP